MKIFSAEELSQYDGKGGRRCYIAYNGLVYDVTGREIKTLVNEVLPQGKHNISFDAGNIASGVYFYKIETGSYKEIKRMILIK